MLTACFVTVTVIGVGKDMVTPVDEAGNRRFGGAWFGERSWVRHPPPTLPSYTHICATLDREVESSCAPRTFVRFLSSTFAHVILRTVLRTVPRKCINTLPTFVSLSVSQESAPDGTVGVDSE